MYLPKQFEETRVEILREFIQQYPLANLVVITDQGVEVDSIPLHLVETETNQLKLIGHYARNNSVWQRIQAQVSVVAVFNGPSAYITPQWYATKKRDGKGVPTWNYSTVQVKGKIQFFEQPEKIYEILQILTKHFEKDLDTPWNIEDSPHDYLHKMLSAVVAFEVEVESMLGKFKLSQNQSNENKEGVMQGLSEQKDPAAQVILKLMQETAR